MKKFILIVSILCMVGAIGLALMNKGFLDRTIAELKKTKDDVKEVTETLGEKEDELDGLKEEESNAKDVRNMASAAVGEVEQSLKIVQRDIQKEKTELEKIQIEQREIEMATKRVFPDGVRQSPAELRMVLTMLEDTLASNETKKAAIDAEVANLGIKKTDLLDVVGKEETFQLERRQKIILGSLEGTVIAVNRDWGFVMVNAGKAHGVEPNASILVKRGNSHIGRLRIVNLQENVCVCDLVPGSSTKGIGLSAGDKVIFENP